MTAAAACPPRRTDRKDTGIVDGCDGPSPDGREGRRLARHRIGVDVFIIVGIGIGEGGGGSGGGRG